MPLSKRILPHGKKSILKNVSGSNVSSLALSDNILQLNQTNNVPQKTVTLPVVGISAGTNVTVSESSGVYTINSSAGGGGGGTPGGSDTQLQYNNDGAFGGSAGMTWNETGDYLTLLSAVGGDASLKLRNTVGTSTANGLSVFDESDNRRLDVGYNNNTNESYIWSYAADVPLKIATNGTERMRILAGGNVGIGTTSPGTNLDVNGNVNLNNQYTTTGGETNPGYYVYKSGDVAYGMKLQYTATKFGTMIFGPDQSSRFISFGKVANGAGPIDNTMIEYGRFNLDDGFFGLGPDGTFESTDPAYRLHVVGTTQLSGNTEVVGTTLLSGNTESVGTINMPTNHGITFDNTNNNNQWFISNRGTNAATLGFGIGNIDNANLKVVFDGDGDVGIGSTNPSEKLQVAGNIRIDDGTSDNRLIFNNHSTVFTSDSNDSSMQMRSYGGSSYNYPIKWVGASGTSNSNRISFHDDFVMISGNKVGIGTTDPVSTLHIKGDTTNFRISSADYDLITMGPRGNTGSNLDKAFINLMSGDGSSKVYFDTAADSYINGGNLGIGTSGPATKLDVKGSITAGSSSYTTISDNEYDVSNGNFLLDVADDITLDAAGGDVKFSKAGGNKFTVYMDTNDNVWLQAKGTDKDLNITGVDNDTGQVTALSFDMSEAGLATFNTTPIVGTMTSSDNSTKAASTAYVTTAVAAAGGGDVSKSGTPVDNQVAIWTGTNTIEGSANLTFDGNHLKLLDDKKLILGTGDDMQLYHNGSNSYVTSQVGDLNILNTANDADIKFKIKDNNVETEVMRIVGATSRVGIGNDSPGYELTLGDKFMWDGNHFRANQTNGASMRNEVPSATNPVFTFNNNVDTGIGRAYAGNLSFITSGASRMQIDGDGKIGVGGTPGSKVLTVHGTTQIDGEFFSTAGADITAGSWRWRDSVLCAFGTDRDVAFTFDNTNDRLLLVSGNSASNTPLMHIGANPTDGMYVAGPVGIGVVAPDTLRQGQGLTISGTAITSTAYTSSTHEKATSLFVPSLGSGSYVLAGIGGRNSQMGDNRAEPPIMVIGDVGTSLHQTTMGGGRAVSLVLAGTAGYNSGGQDYGNFGSLLFHGNSNWSGNARRWLVTNAWRRSGAGDMGLGFASETSASLDPTVSGSTPSVVFSTDSNYGTAGKGGLLVGNTSHIATGKVTVVDADNGVPLTLAWDGSNYTTFSMNSGGDTVIQAHQGYLNLKTDSAGERIRLDSKGDVQADLGGAAGTYLFKVVDSSQNWLFTVHDDGLVGLHGSDPAIEIKERASAPNHTAAFGKLWVKNDDPANLYYTDDAGNDIALTDNGSAAGGGGGSAAGADTQVQFNDGGSSFGGDAGLTYVKGTDTLTVASNININANLISGSSGHLQLYAADNVNLNSEAGITNFNYRGTETFRIAAGASSPVTLQPKASGYDLSLAAQDGTSVLHLDSTDKHIGIGTTNPSYALDVYDAGTSFVGRFKNASTNGYVLRLEASDSTLDFQTDHMIPSYNMHLGNDNVNWYFRTAGRKLGVGTSSPATAFHVSGTNIVSRFQDTTGVAFTDIKRIAVENSYAATVAGGQGQALGTTADAYTDIWTNKSRYISFRHATGSTTDGATTYMSGSRASSEYLKFKTTGNNYSKGGIISAPNELYIITESKDMSLNSANNLTTHYDKEYVIYNDTGNPVFHIRSGSSAAIEFEGDGDMRFKQAGTSTKMSLIANGNVGINQTTPVRKLHVVEGSNGYAARFEDGIELDGSNVQLLGYGQGNLWMMGNSGDPKLTLGYSHNWDYAVSLKYLKNSTAFSGLSEFRVGQLDKNNANWDHGITSFYTSGSETMRLTADNKVGIGTTPDGGTPNAPIAKLHVADTASADVGIALTNSDTGHGANDGFQFYIDTSKNAYLINREASDMKFYTSNAQKMVIKSDGKVGIGTTTPSNTLEVAGVIRGTNYIWQKQDGTPGILLGNGGDADIYYDGSNMFFNAARTGTGKEIHITDIHASGASFQNSMGESVYIRAAHAGFDSNAILQQAPNIQYVKAEQTSAPGVGAIPTELPLAESGKEGLEITVMQRWDADPEGALTVQKQTGSSDVIYEGGSNSASATVSIPAYRGANKTFVVAAVGVWVVKD